MKLFHLNFDNFEDKENRCFIAYIDEISDDLREQLPSKLSITKVNYRCYKYTWINLIKFEKDDQDEFIDSVIGIIRSNGYKHVDIQGRSHPSII